jgi:hypothetical protein
LWSRGEGVRCDGSDQLTDRKVRVGLWVLQFGLWVGGPLRVWFFRWAGVDKMDAGVAVAVPRGWRVDDAVVGVADDGVAVVAEPALVWVVSEEFLEELGSGGEVAAFGARLSITARELRVWFPASEAASEGAGVSALVFGIGVRVDGVIVVVWVPGCGVGVVASLQHGFRGANKGGWFGGWVGAGGR